MNQYKDATKEERKKNISIINTCCSSMIATMPTARDEEQKNEQTKIKDSLRQLRDNILEVINTEKCSKNQTLKH